MNMNSYISHKPYCIGQERYQSITRLYYRGAGAMIICHDVNDEKTFDNCNKWRHTVEQYGNNDVVVMLVGCKIDKVGSDYHTNTVEAKALSIIQDRNLRKFEASFCECSAKTCDNVRNIFLIIMLETYQSKGLRCWTSSKRED